MKYESLRTFLFIAVALISGLLAFWTNRANQPPQATGFELVGQPFFADFQDPKSAEYLEIAALDDSAELQSFALQKSNGLWRIPTHSNYPAETADRLATTSTALIGLQREALVGRLATEHERYGVLDPKDTANNDPEKTGKRLTLKDGSGQVLADLIIGKAVAKDDPGLSERSFDAKQEELFFVRKADEVQTYKAALRLNLSTRFSDWINTRLIDVSAPQVEKLRIDNYQLINNPQDPLGASRLKRVGDQLNLNRDKVANQWKMEGLDATKEQLKLEQVDSLLDTLLDLQIVGVREKFRYQGRPLIGPDMKLIKDEELMKDQNQYGQVLQKVAQDLSSRGFYLQAPERGEMDSLQLVSDSGQISFTTNEGLVYWLDLGKAIEGDAKAIEIGTADASNPEAKENLGDQKEAGATQSANAQQTDAAALESKGKEAIAPPENPASTLSGKNRFVLIRVTLDESQVSGGPPSRPIEPVKPKTPDGYVPPESPTDQGAKDSHQADAPKAEGDAPVPEIKPQERDPKFVEFEQEMAKYEAAKTQYEIDLSRFEKQQQQYQEAVGKARKKVEEMNERFGAWYYVVSAFNLEQLRLDRSSLVEAVKPPEVSPAESVNPIQKTPEAVSPEGLTPPASDKPPESTQQSESGDGTKPKEPEKKDR